MKIYIYTLSCPLTGEVRYVGKTVNPTKRLDNHLNVRHKTHCSCWVQSLKNKGLKPVFDILDETEECCWEFWEIFYIGLFRGWGLELTNHCKGGRGANGNKQSEASNLKRSNALKGRKLGTYSAVRIENARKGLLGRTAWNKGKTGIYSEKTLAMFRLRDLRGSKNPSAKLSDEDALEIRNRVAAGEKQIILSKEFNVSKGTINKLIKRRSFKHL